MRFSTFTKHCDLIQSRLESVNKQIITLNDLSTVTALNDQQLHKLRLLSSTASQKYSEFERHLNKLFSTSPLPDDLDDKKITTFQETISDLYVGIQSVCNTLIPSAQPEQLNESNNSVQQQSQEHKLRPTAIKLPQINLPTFSGQAEQWIAFQSLFENTIHLNDSISNVEKFTYLLSCLSDEPLNLIKSLPLNSANYLIAWENLRKRYHNSRLLITLHTNNILDLPQLYKPTPSQLRNFVSVYNDNYQALRALGQDISTESLLLSAHVLRKLDPRFRSDFEHKREDPNKVPTIDEIITFIENECAQQEAANMSNLSSSTLSPPSKGFTSGFKNNSYTPKTTGMSNTKPSKVSMLSTSRTVLNCIYCNSALHNIYRCDGFSLLSPQNRHSWIKGKGLCQNCFGSHKLDSCKSLHSCRVCMKRHHTLLHFDKSNELIRNKSNSASNSTPQQNVQSATSPNSSNDTTATSSTLMGVTENKSTVVLLATALVNVSTEKGNNIVVRGVLDSASQTTIISEHCANLLQIQRTHIGIPGVIGISSTQIKPKGLTHVNLSSLSGTLLSKSHPVLILNKISNNLPRTAISLDIKAKLKNYTLADPTFDTPGPIDILIGADLFAQTLKGAAVSLGENLPYTMNTIFGYIVLGSTPIANPSYHFAGLGLSSFLSISDFEIHNTLQRFWSLEEPPTCTSRISPEDQECEKHFLSTHSREATGRYVCRLPFQKDPTLLGDSENIAKGSFKALERKFNSNAEFKQKYLDFISEYKSSGHMELCNSPILTANPHCFLSHHGVFKDGKIRVVFNASAPTSSGISLNDIQYQGPKLHNEITDIIFRFRQYKVAFSCDIKQMFRMISIHEEDQHFQLLYWRDDPSLPLEIFKLTTVTFGLTSSPFLANRVIQQLIQDEGNLYPLASKALQHQLYVDDALLGSDTVEEALTLQQEVIHLLRKGGFELRKWVSNDAKLLENLPSEHCVSPLMLKSSDQPCISILGLKWNPDNDSLSYHIEKPSHIFTKRALLSTIARIYDLTGMLAPLIFWAKALMQHVWSLGLDWDTPLPDNISDRWSTFLNELPEIENLKINRYLPLTDAVNIQLHGFSDASELGYAACVYLRTEDALGNVALNLLIAKSRVAPLKRTTMPRLELCGAHILAKLIQYVVMQLAEHYNISSVTAWSDSTIVLSWIRTPSYRLKLYVANRIVQIQELTPSCIWKHVPSSNNPADCASRGMTALNLIRHDQWWFGPSWLKGTPEKWPNSSFSLPEEEMPEIKPATLHLMTMTEDQKVEFLRRFSSWTTLTHVMGYVLRFISHLRNKTKDAHPSLTLQELKLSETHIYKLIQAESFPQDIVLLRREKTCSHRIQRLAPFIDEDGLLRVGGRLRNSNLSYDAKHQIILPKNHYVVHLIIDHYHKIFLHAGPVHLQAALQQKYWILSARSVIRSRVFKCIPCFKNRPKFTYPMMGDLPTGRVVPTRCFNVSAVDYAGPFNIKLFRLRKPLILKVYLCLFICFVSKAVHLEVVTDLTTDAFIAALTRFISRRGLVSDLHSDCGTNFIGTASTLKRCFEELMKKPETQQFAENHHLCFHFNPPRAPHQGGLWERAIKSAKHHLTRVIGNQILTYEEFITLTSRIEAMLNSRPLTQLSADPNDLLPLTPGHFLTGGPLTSLIEPQFNDLKLLRRWQLVQGFGQHIWARWRQEYLHTLQQRSKWTKPQDNLRVGELVVIHEDNAAPFSWKMGRITKVSPGKDGIVRVVDVKTSTRTFTRPVVKVSRLPID